MKTSFEFEDALLFRSDQGPLKVQFHHHEAFLVAGLTTKLSPVLGDRDTQIKDLWEYFFAAEIYRAMINRTSDLRLYGAYSPLALAGRPRVALTIGPAVSMGPFAVRIEAGNYLAFSGQSGGYRKAQGLWSAANTFFERNPTFRRKRGVDFEVHSGPDSVKVCVGVY